MRTIVTLYLLFVFAACVVPARAATSVHPKSWTPATFDERFHFDVPHEKPKQANGGKGFA